VAAILAVIFISIAAMLLEMVYSAGSPSGDATNGERHEPAWLVAGPVALMAVVLILGLHLPAPLRDVLARAAADLGGSVP
jgi:formate hydrogenlyase subunit 3/multisubunit Na+/H+ antiporter MnhD subunit